MKIKYFLLAGLFSLLAQAYAAEPANNTAGKPAETKKVCIDKTDQKTKKTVQECKEVKVHKKLEGTKVPPK